MSELTKKDILLMIKVIKANYSYAYQNANSEDVTLMTNVWFECLKKYPKEIVNQAFRETIETNKYPPTIADIIEKIKSMVSAVGESDQELWGELCSAVYKASVLYSRFDYTAIPLGETKTQGESAREEMVSLFNNLSPIVKEYVSSVNQLIELTFVESLEYEKGRFLKAVPALRERLRTKKMISPELLKVLSNYQKSSNENKQLTDKTD